MGQIRFNSFLFRLSFQNYAYIPGGFLLHTPAGGPDRLPSVGLGAACPLVSLADIFFSDTPAGRLYRLFQFLPGGLVPLEEVAIYFLYLTPAGGFVRPGK